MSLTVGSRRKLMSVLAAATVALAVMPSVAQDKTPTVKTNGSCSPVVHGNHNVIDCGKLSPHDAALLAQILNEARSSNKSLSDIKDLLEKALNPYRTIVTYGPNGQELDTSSAGGTYEAISDGETAAYMQFLDMEKAGRWHDMISLAETERQKAPTWYTVDFYEAEGYAGLCNLRKTKEYADKFIEEVSGIPPYEQMASLARASKPKIDAEIARPGSFRCVSDSPQLAHP